ncbi:MAG: cell division protein FtsZ [Synoicihabitans sp.]
MSSSELPLPPPSADALADRSVAIKVVGIGGAGGNAVDRLKMDGLDRLQLASINTDLQALNSSPVEEKILIGSNVTRGLGAGGDPEIGFQAVEADRDKVSEALEGCDLVFLIAGMGGGTGGGCAPTIAEIASEAGALVIAFAPMPFTFEGSRRAKQAEEGLAALRSTCDAVIPLPNDLLLQEATDGETALDSFSRADDWIGRAVRSVWAMLFRTGLINLDFATLQQAFHSRGGKTLFGLGVGQGEDAAAAALASLDQCPLLAIPEHSRKADRLLVNIIGGTDLTLAKVNQIMGAITERYGRESHVIMGAVIDEDLQGKVEICVIGTTDIGGRGAMRHRTTAPFSSHTQPTVPRAKAPHASSRKPAPAKSRSKAATAAAADPTAQDEFLFQGTVENRGRFERTDRNLFEGQDLDVPTYLRKGIKISV